MTTISAQVIAHSICLVSGKQIATLQLRYPRCIHAEFMTHRQFSRNASSSRAVPVKKLIEDVLKDPFVPLVWGKNQKGMQATQECDSSVLCGFVNSIGQRQGVEKSRRGAWLEAMNQAVFLAQSFDEAGYHKQIVNRLLEPFSHINVVVTSTEWSNFFALRDHKDAEPHISELARVMKKALRESNPRHLTEGEWHLPYVDPLLAQTDYFTYRMVSGARCARVSYLTHSQLVPSLEEDLALYRTLVGNEPLHASPTEHQAIPDPNRECPELWGNFQGWIQHRKTLQGECK
jgi:thymidylate synthase ThyX